LGNVLGGSLLLGESLLSSALSGSLDLSGGGGSLGLVLGSGGLLLEGSGVSLVSLSSALAVSGVQGLHSGVVSEGVESGELSDVGSLGSESSLDLLRVDDSEDISVGELRSGESVSLLLDGRSSSSVSKDLVQRLEGILGPDDESANVTTRGQSQEVKSSDGAELDSRNVSEGSSHGSRLGVDNEGTSSSSPSAISGLSLSLSLNSVISDLLAVLVGLQVLEDGNGSLGLGDGVNNRVVNDEGNLGNLRDSVSSSHDKSGDGRSSDSRGEGKSSLLDIDSSVPSSPNSGGGKHSSLSAHVSKSSLSGSRGTSSRNSRNTGNGSSSSPGDGRSLLSSHLRDRVWLSVVLGHSSVDISNHVISDGGGEDVGKSNTGLGRLATLRVAGLLGGGLGIEHSNQY